MRVGQAPDGVVTTVGGAGGDDNNMLAVVTGLQPCQNSSSQSEPVPLNAVQSLDRVHARPWGEEASITVHADGAWASQAQAISSVCYLEDGTTTCEDGIDFRFGN